ncbi:hypothetical protein PUH89_06535 [Rhodobacter capsulatus]|uniref:Uncharacterized protein n=1 Tax=Rhodobacter capsulatus TaxID=1061 RepID=A0A1G7LRH3_RHOCA|nr:hypothetical protein [Rhodobacter capsulatus]WER10628.1 hypothetical protein PUH89_06535 [Rhodobacter capsulatus]SDF51590.1 hypothetical protein SAMN04244550_02367 [Rhodobacter capsulatus]
MTPLPVRSGYADETDASLIKEAILDELGEWAFGQICEAFGGQQIDIPARANTVTEGHFLSQALGLDNARLLCEAVGPARFYVPRLCKAEDRDARLVDMVRSGLANWEISRAVSLTERHVRRRLSQLGVSNPNRKPRNRYFGASCATAAGGAS